MKKQYACLLTLLFVFGLLSNNALAQYTWKVKADFGGIGRCGPVGFSIGNYGYIGTGYSGSYNLSDFWQYDPATNTWSQKSTLPIAIRWASSFVINSKGYVTGGIGASVFNAALYMYDPVANTWTLKTPFPGVARYGGAGFAIGGKGYYGIGNAGSAYGPYYADFYEYDAAADTWTQKATFPGTTRYGTYGISLNGKGYAGFGGNENLGIQFNDWWQYDPTADTWTNKASLPAPVRGYPAAFIINNLVYLGTGISGTSALNDFFEYDPVSDVWTQKANYPAGNRWLVAGFSIGSIGYFGTGADGNGYYSHKEFWEYSPSVVPPTASFESSDSIICANGCINFTDHSTNATSWNWFFQGGAPSSSTDQHPQNICYLTGGAYNVKLIASNSGASDTLNFTNYITVNPAPPVPVITRSGDTLSFSRDSSYVSYLWYFNNVIVPGAADTFYVGLQNGNYNVQVTDTNGCSIAVGIILLGLKDIETNSYFNIYPNPVNGRLNISILKATPNANIEVFDIFGKQLFLKTISSYSETFFSVDLDKYPKGVYFLAFNIGSEKIIKKFIKTD